MMRIRTNAIQQIVGIVLSVIIFGFLWFVLMLGQTGALTGLQSANPTEMNDQGVTFLGTFWWSLPALFLIFLIFGTVIEIQRRKPHEYQ